MTDRAVLTRGRFCFIKLSLLLIAIEARSEDGTESSISINPGHELKLDSNSQGFFIAESADDVKRYCSHSRLSHLYVTCIVPHLSIISIVITLIGSRRRVSRSQIDVETTTHTDRHTDRQTDRLLLLVAEYLTVFFL